jgi:hypothetical protein
VKALVYIAAVVPDRGETVGEVFHRVAPHSSAPQLQPHQDGWLVLNVEAFRNAVAPDASSEVTALMAANQKPISIQCLGDRLYRLGMVRCGLSWPIQTYSSPYF